LALLGIILSAYALINLATISWCLYLLIFANGMFSGLHGVLTNVSWPRFFGLTHLGAISGFAMSLNVAGSALGPAIFSLAEQRGDNNYDLACYIVLIISMVLLVFGFKANNPNKLNI